MNEREEFEAWHLATYPQHIARHGDTYKNAHVRCRWQGFQAGRASLAASAGSTEINGQLYMTLNNLFTHLGMEGCITADHAFVWDAMTALKRIDGGVHLDNLAVPVDPDAHRDDMLAAVQLLEDGEWAEHFAKTPIGMRLEDQITKLHSEVAASAGSEPVAPSEDVQKKIQSNTWDHFGSILPTLKAISRGDWYWGANSRCKYIEIRLDTRDGGCLLFDSERVRISPEQFAHQSYGGVKMEPWPATDLTHPSPPEGMAGWISVDERLPQPFTPVLIHPRPTDYCCEGEVNTQRQWSYGEYETGFGHHQIKCKVTHWQPMPAPPLPASEAKEP